MESKKEKLLSKKSFIFALFIGIFLSVNTINAQEKPDTINSIIEQCRTRVGSYGASLVKTCVDLDLQALKELSEYPNEWSVVINRCMSQMLTIGGWNLVKTCVDLDISAEKALQGYQSKYKE